MRDRARVNRGQRQRNRLFRDLPDRKERAENDGKINRALKDAAFFVFGTDEQCVGRFESFGGVSFVFHRVDLVDDQLLLHRPCPAFMKSHNQLTNSSLQHVIRPNDVAVRFRPRDYLFRIWDAETRTKQKRRGMNLCASIERILPDYM